MQHKAEIVESLESYVSEHLSLLKPVDKIWQPSDFLPDSSQEGWFEKISELREESRDLPDDVLVTLVGDMITEEALPSYQTMINRFEGVADETGDSDSAWAKWSRGWTAEENRHGDLLNRFLYLLGRVDMRAIEVTIQKLIKNGFNAGMDNDPYKGFIYTSFQERATKISHANVGLLAKKAGASILAKICAAIAGDEARHEEAYKRFMVRIFEVDPENAMIAFRDMMKKTITMPAKLMEDAHDTDLYKKFSEVAQRLGVYTVRDYADIIDHLIEYWHIPAMTDLKGEAAKAQEYLCTLAERYRKLADRFESKMPSIEPVPFSWIHNRTA